MPVSHNRPWLTQEDRAAVDAALASGWIAQGPAVADLEARFVAFQGGGGACALSSGSAALFLALKALGAKTGESVALPTYACSALLNAVHMAGATPRVVDVLADTFCLDPAGLEDQASDAAFAIAVHAYGAPADVAALRRPDRRVIEDCCQSLGGRVSGLPLGGEGDAAVFSFYATKIVTGGQGGLLWSRDPAVAEAARDYRQFDCRETYVPRFNFQMSDIQAALVNSQLARLDEIRARRARIAGAYLTVLPAGFTTQAGLTDAGRMAYRFVVLAPDRDARDALRRHLEAHGVGCIVPVERHELLHRYLQLDPDRFPVAERLADITLSLPLYPALSDAEVAQVCGALETFRP